MKLSKKEAMEYVINEKRGYVDELVKKIGEENFKTLALIGFIKQGKEKSNKDSWQATKSLEEFLKPYRKKLSIFDKIRYFINSKLV